MLTRQSTRTVLYLAATGLFAGCAQPGPILSGRSTFGTLKTSVSHLEYENQQLRTKVTQIESENRELENRLVQEETTNGELTARLDDARNLLSHQGFEINNSTGSLGPENPSPDGSRAHTLPAGRSDRKPRKPPFARIPGQIDSSQPAQDSPPRPGMPGSDAFEPQSSWRDDSQWLPIARAPKEAPSRVR